MNYKIDILENEILQKYPSILEILLKDQTTKKNIIWATNNYESFGARYLKESSIEIDLITGVNGHVIMPRVKKNISSQLSRTKGMAEVFTPSWVCNLQNNSIDNLWFDRENVFNREIKTGNSISWKTTKERIIFPKGKRWKDYIQQRRLEITCGEAPYVTSRYDTVSGQFIEVEDRIGFLDRKLRIINENIDSSREWLRAAQIAYKNTYAFEWQGDSLLLARQSLLFTFIENYKYKFKKEPLMRSVRCIADIISWNIWQMDGLKGVIPFSCDKTIQKNMNLLPNEKANHGYCQGCVNNSILDHNGVYCLIKDWKAKDKKTGQTSKKIMFIDLIKS